MGNEGNNQESKWKKKLKTEEKITRADIVMVGKWAGR